jgi:cytochrome c-type biogenesis protein CcmH
LPETRQEKQERRLLRIHSAIVLILLLSFVLLGTDAATAALTTQDVEESLTCQCGCGLTVHSCNHLQCGFAVPVKAEIVQQLGEGKNKETIVADFMARYGEKVLSAPTTSGFNLVAWLTPFLVVAVGGVLIGIAGVRWSRRRAQDHVEQPPVSPQVDLYRDRLRKELENFEE